MKRLYWVSVFFVLLLGLYFSMNISIHPETKSVIPWGQYETPEEMGTLLFGKMQEVLKDHPIIILGVTPNKIEDVEFWRGFLEAAQSTPQKYEMIVVEPMLPYVELFQTAVHIDLKEEMSRFIEGAQKARAKGVRIAIVVPTIYSSKLLKNNPANRLADEFQLSTLSFSITKFPITRQQAESFEPKCVMEEGRDLEGTGALGCAIQNTAAKVFRKKLEQNKFSGFVEQVKVNDYLIFLNRNPVIH